MLHRWRLALVLALAVGVVAVGRTGSFVAGGADSYGYISEARLWLGGDLHVRQDVMQAAQWPNAQGTFTPLGYTPASDPFMIVPVHAPGLPLLMAGAVLVAGWCAAFWIVPVSGAVLVVSTYAIGARVGRPLVGLAAAWLVATSPAILSTLVNPMSDLPAAACFAAAVAFVLGPGRAAAGAAGLAVAAGILIRPNLVPVAAPFVIYTLVGDLRIRPRTLRALVTPWFVAAVALGVIVEGAVNDRLYGSPFSSGYGTLDYQAAYFWPNVRVYAEWLASTQTPAVFLGLASLGLPIARLWTTPSSRRALWFLSLYAAAVALPFLFHTVREAWWYLRYVAAMWPVMMLGVAACAAAVWRTGRPWARVAAVLALAALGWHGLSDAGRRGVFQTRAGEQKYIDAARIVGARVALRDAVLAVQHSGSVRHYAGRMTIRWDLFQPGTLDRAIDWLAASGHHPYLLAEPWEIEIFRERYGGSDAVGQLDWAPLVTLEAASVVHLYDLSDRTGRPQATEIIATHGLPAGEQCIRPAAPLPFDW